LGRVSFVNRLFGTREQVAGMERSELLARVRGKHGKVDPAIKLKLRHVKK
jgi:hypothetical protein